MLSSNLANKCRSIVLRPFRLMSPNCKVIHSTKMKTPFQGKLVQYRSEAAEKDDLIEELVSRTKDDKILIEDMQTQLGQKQHQLKSFQVSLNQTSLLII